MRLGEARGLRRVLRRRACCPTSRGSRSVPARAPTRRPSSTSPTCASTVGEPAAAPRPPLHVEVFNHVLTDNSRTAYEAEVELPPANWAFGARDPDARHPRRRRGLGRVGPQRRGLGLRRRTARSAASCPSSRRTARRATGRWTSPTSGRWLAGKTTLRGRRGHDLLQEPRLHDERVARLPPRAARPSSSPTASCRCGSGTAHYRSAENHFQDFFDAADGRDRRGGRRPRGSS